MVEKQKQNMNLNAVRLRFQAYLPDESGCFSKALPPCISHPVYDSSKMNQNEFPVVLKHDVKSERKVLQRKPLPECQWDDTVKSYIYETAIKNLQGQIIMS